MPKAVVIDADAANRLNLGGGYPDDWVGDFSVPTELKGVRRILKNDIIYLLGDRANKNSRLLVVKGDGRVFFPELPLNARLECFMRMLRVGMSKLQTAIRIPLDWRPFHKESLISFQTNRITTGVKSRACVDFAPEGTNHVYAYSIDSTENGQLNKDSYNKPLFEEAVLRFEEALNAETKKNGVPQPTGGQLSVALTQSFSDSDIAQGVPFSVWRDSKLTKQQRGFFDAPFDGPLRVRGAAGTGKTLVLTLRFLKEIYARLDQKLPVRAAFLAHGQETADHVRTYLMLIDERGLLTDTPHLLDLQITTLHGIANEFIQYDAEKIQPLSLDGTDGRKMQFELVQSLVSQFNKSSSAKGDEKLYREGFRIGLFANKDDEAGKAFSVDLIDEFANVLETFGTRNVDEIADKYIKSTPGPRALAHNEFEKKAVLEIYREFRSHLAELGVISLDQFIADYVAYLNSFRWEAVRPRSGFDFVFADELHLFNRQERPVLGYLLKDNKVPRVAVAYDPRQSPRNSFFPHDRQERDTIWSEARLDSKAQQFELTDVFRYTPQILAFLDRLNRHFPADDLAEEWGLTFGTSRVADGPMPHAFTHKGKDVLASAVSKRARELTHRAKKGQRVAVLCLDHERFNTYRQAGIFQDGFVTVAARNEIGEIQRYGQRAVLSMPEYVAGLQFECVILVDANSNLISEMGGRPKRPATIHFRCIFGCEPR